MPSRALLLRLVLCLVLVLTGTGSAMASVRMAIADATARTMARAVLDDAEPAPSCHGEPAEHHGADAATPVAPETEVPTGKTTCCDSGACACTCMQHALAMLPSVASPGMTVLLALRSTPLPDGRPAPALPHPIRPPIG